MKLTLEETVQLPSGTACTVRVEYDGDGVAPDTLLREVGRALARERVIESSDDGRGESNGDVREPSSESDGAKGDAPHTRIRVHGKAKNTVHKVVLALDQRASRGTPATVDDIERGTGLSRPAIYRVLDPDTPQGRYARGLIRAEKEGNAYAIDITQAGRNMASRLRTRPV